MNTTKNISINNTTEINMHVKDTAEISTQALEKCKAELIENVNQTFDTFK